MKEILFVIVELIANTVQAITGFAGAPLAMPPSVALVGVENAKASITMIMWFSTLALAVQNIKYINWKKLGTILSFMIIGVVMGMWIFMTIDVSALMLIYGIIVVMIGIKHLFVKKKLDLPIAIQFFIVFLAGIMQGLFTSGGPFLALYATTAMKDKKEFRATVSMVWAVLNTYLVCRMYQKEFYTLYVLKLVLYSVVPVTIGIIFGNKISKKLNQEAFLKLVYILLILSGSILILNH